MMQLFYVGALLSLTLCAGVSGRYTGFWWYGPGVADGQDTPDSQDNNQAPQAPQSPYDIYSKYELIHLVTSMINFTNILCKNYSGREMMEHRYLSQHVEPV